MKRKLAEERLSMVAERRQLLEEKRNTQEEIIKTDNGPQLNPAEFNTKYCTANCITHEKVTPKWAQLASGEVEGQNRSMEKRKNDRIAKVCLKIQRTSSDNNGKEPSRPRQAQHEHHQRNQQDPQDTRKCCKGMMTMLQAFKLTLSCQNSRTDH